MANTAMLPPETDPTTGSPTPDGSFHLIEDVSIKDEGVFASLMSNLRDVFFPVKLPPLVLESKPVPVVDRMAVKRDPKATAIATVINAGILLLAIWWGSRVVHTLTNKPTINIALDAPPPPAPMKKIAMGGGGGQKGPTPVSKGNPPKFAPNQIVPPIAPPKIQAKLQVDPTVNVQQDLHMAKIDIPNIGMTNGPSVNMSMGNGNGSGLGSGDGNGMGPGKGGNYGGGVYRIGGGVSEPQLLYQPEPEFSEEARKAKLSGIVLVGMLVDPTGKATHVHILRGLGMGLDEKAMEAVSRYRFKPAMKDGKPVTVEINVEVNFQIF